MDNFPTPLNNQRLGMHYLPDGTHYSQSDLDQWLPRLEAVGAQWLTIMAERERAIPEHFLQGLVTAGIEPILQFDLSAECPVCGDEVAGMLKAYANWGINYISPFRPPNSRANWSATGWAEKNLVARFMERFIAIAELIVQAGMFPVFPGLSPGGDYWDTSFLRSALDIAAASGSPAMEKMVLGMQAWAGDREIHWGAGGPERWPEARPYDTPNGSEDQLGVRIFDWYQAIAAAAFGRNLPMVVLAGGSTTGKGVFSGETTRAISHADRNREIAKLISQSPSDADAWSVIPTELLCFNFWLLNNGDEKEEAENAWFKNDGEPNETGAVMSEWREYRKKGREDTVGATEDVSKPTTTQISTPSFEHYLLLPTYEWGVADWHLEVIRPFVKKHQPTVGYSVEEAAMAAKVTVVGGEKSFSQEVIEGLVAHGCEVKRIEGDGTKIASQLMTL